MCEKKKNLQSPQTKGQPDKGAPENIHVCFEAVVAFHNISTLNAKLGVSKPMIHHHHDTKTCSGPGNAAFLSAFSTKVIAVQLWMTGSV